MTYPLAGSDLSRRSLVKTAATAAAVGGALALAGPAAGAEAATVPGQTAADAPEHRPEAGDGVLVRVLDARLGTLEVYTEHGHRTCTDRALAAQLARLAR
ncbi:hypothetical protein KDK95_31700 [Actinospica sp. MGRD01-02]|uniref:Uncharacterized protein n=1 Tax=Actinospica acidithermotolerans TaxID=2828514 RepID=A0A941EGA0_9ACTN|nr:hypothetical protein [Actinospica acidithermotolerans]MBR7830912.1 hypothetical protein [Actinospica acidithermotolerans]